MILNSYFLLKKKKAGSQILDWMYARGVGVTQMRTVCNRGGVGGGWVGGGCVRNSCKE